MTDHHLPEHWIEKVCVLLSVPGWLSGSYPHQIVRLFTAWERAEGGGAEWDPLNTTDHLRDTFGSWEGVDWNSIGVAQFTTPFHGIVATAATLLENRAFAGLVAAIRAAALDGTSAETIVQQNQAAIRTWGTNPTTMLSILASTP